MGPQSGGRHRPVIAALALLLAAQDAAPVPLLRDPIHDGAADASTVYDPATAQWRMFYTNRRANLALADPDDVSWVHGTHIGTATSRDGMRWTYDGPAALPAKCTGPTLWAPEVQRFGDAWHMWLTVVPGIFADWNAPRFIVHLTSRDGKQWACADRLDLGSDRVIDASVAALPNGGYRLWFNDERQAKSVRYADSANLRDWTMRDTVIDTPGEGPKAFAWRGSWWLLSDAWRGLLVMRSADATAWVRQPGYLLGDAGTRPTDRAKGQHPDVIVVGDRAFVIYFVQQSGEDEMKLDPRWGRRSVLQIAELREAGGVLSVDREAAVRLPCR